MVETLFMTEGNQAIRVLKVLILIREGFRTRGWPRNDFIHFLWRQ